MVRPMVFPEDMLATTPAGRLAQVAWLLHPTDDEGNELEPVITEEQARLLLDHPTPRPAAR